MAQQTRIEALLPYYERFIKAFPMLKDLADASGDEVLRVWQGLGYYSRARNLHKAAQIVLQRHGGVLPKQPTALLKLPGIGAYTAGAIASIAFNVPAPAVDGNALRVFARLCCIQADVRTKEANDRVAEMLSAMMETNRPCVLTQAVMELGALICLPKNPKCENCPVCALCCAKQQGREGELPVRKPNKPQRMEQRAVLLLVDAAGRVLVRRRTERLLGGLYEFPGFASYGEMEEALTLWGAKGDEPERVRKARHVFTHIVWEMEGYLVLAQNESDIEGTQWIALKELPSLAMPAAMRAFVEYLTQTDVKLK